MEYCSVAVKGAIAAVDKGGFGGVLGVLPPIQVYSTPVQSVLLGTGSHVLQ